MEKDLTLRAIGITSLMLTIPAEYIRALGLKAGDVVSFKAEGDSATLKFYKVTRTECRVPALNESVSSTATELQQAEAE
jgi:bifunctional DNA-binding transcriptional regulator/antitoxin component of YhaV-PrlF toxin-antitoxin module